MNNSNITTNYNRHIRNAREFSKGLAGYERAEKIAEYFSQSGHPHAQYTFNQLANNRTSDTQLANQIIKDMASLVAENEMLTA